MYLSVFYHTTQGKAIMRKQILGISLKENKIN